MLGRVRMGEQLPKSIASVSDMLLLLARQANCLCEFEGVRSIFRRKFGSGVFTCSWSKLRGFYMRHIIVCCCLCLKRWRLRRGLKLPFPTGYLHCLNSVMVGTFSSTGYWLLCDVLYNFAVVVCWFYPSTRAQAIYFGQQHCASG